MAERPNRSFARRPDFVQMLPHYLMAAGYNCSAINTDLNTDIDPDEWAAHQSNEVLFQGRSFLGKQKEPHRDYVCAARDRLDNCNEVIRTIRREKYRYIRNFLPHRPYVSDGDALIPPVQTMYRAQKGYDRGRVGFATGDQAH